LNNPFGADLCGQVPALFVGSDVAPDESRSNYARLLIKQDRAVHLSREPDTVNFIAT
jgi:hypothetical protein